ncbi:Uncharacterised protein [Raoultella ornithinolytica]|nr:Uncharacterised protein [Raoultella ornithinolytica]
MRIAHFVPGLFDGLFADAGFRLVVIQQPGAGFDQHPVLVTVNPGGNTKLADQYDGLLTAVIQQHRGAVAAIVNLALMTDHAAVATRQLVGHIAQNKVVFREEFIFDNVDVE